MALSSNSTNRFGPSSYIVGTVIGDGCNFTTVQAAISQAVADGFNTANPTTVLVRPGTYGSFTMAPGIQVEGICAGSAFSNTATIVGNITIDSTTVGGVTYAIKNLNVSDPVDAVIIQGVGPTLLVDIANCSISGTRGIVIGNTSATFSQIAIRESRVVATTIAVDLQQHNTVFTEQSTYSGTTCFALSGDSRLNLFDCVLDATTNYGVELTGNNNRVGANFTNITSVLESIIGTNSSETIQVNHCTFASSAPSGNYIDGIDNFEFYDLALKGTALLNNAIAVTFIDWQPHAGSAANATLPGAVRGTSAFNNSQFTVTNGFVELDGAVPVSFPTDSGTATPALGVLNIFGGPGVRTFGIGNTITVASVEFNDVSASQALITDTGYFSSGSITLTLPAAPGQGELLEIGCVTAGAILQANAGQTIRIGNLTSSVAGTATSTDVGDSLILRYNAANNRWHSMSVVGSWTLA